MIYKNCYGQICERVEDAGGNSHADYMGISKAKLIQSGDISIASSFTRKNERLNLDSQCVLFFLSLAYFDLISWLCIFIFPLSRFNSSTFEHKNSHT